MESKWYLFPGQTYENTKISDRAHALHITSDAWNNITQHLDRKKRIQEAIDKEKAHKAALKAGSEAMTKTWENSTENLRLRKEEERKTRMGKKNQDKLQEFFKIKKHQEEERKKYVEKVQKEAYILTGPPKQLTSALILSETLYERGKQLEFNDFLKKQQDQINKQHDDNIIAMDEKHKKEDEDQKKGKFEKQKEIAEILKRQIFENEETVKANNRSHIERETKDRINAEKEEKLIKECELELKKKKRREMALEKKKALEAERKWQQILAREEAEMEKATQFYSDAKKRIDCMLKAKTKEMEAEALKQKEIMALKVAAIKESQEGVEAERIAKAVAERDAQDKAQAEEKATKEALAKRDRIEDRNQYLKRLEDEKNAEREIKRWELLNRQKVSEVMKDYDEQKRKDRWAKILEYRKDLLDQMADEKQVQEQEKEIDNLLSKVSFDEVDRKFFEYAGEVLDLAKTKNRSLYPIEKVIQEYKKTNGMTKPPPRPCKCFKDCNSRN